MADNYVAEMSRTLSEIENVPGWKWALGLAKVKNGKVIYPHFVAFGRIAAWLTLAAVLLAGIGAAASGWVALVEHYA